MMMEMIVVTPAAETPIVTPVSTPITTPELISFHCNRILLHLQSSYGPTSQMRLIKRIQ
jgi:hypothetical protein